jgi:N6-L-threonylcarbamoyladenine synthase/protein kinase Bud32
MRVLGIEGTAWMASAAVYDTADDEPTEFHDRYEPDSGGIHPREAAEHMSDAVPAVVADALAHARDRWGDEPLDAVAFSRGPGLGPCLRIVGTAARALAGRLDVPLVGVNHMIAHLEIGRHQSGFDAPVCLNASGANAHLLGFHGDRYRVLGETLDTGVGNALDKFTRHLGWSHPGGPKVERHAADGEYHELPYVVKGMDFSFSGIVSAAQQAIDDGVPTPDVCAGLQETIFGMLTEVSERALSLTGADELVLGGGVGQNDRLREMLQEMCAQRDAEFFAPAPRYLRDNASMIAVLGARMAAAGDTVTVPDSAVDPEFRPDEVPVTWRDEGRVSRATAPMETVRGAEATVTVADPVIKRREPKTYRHPELDDRLRRERTTHEARLLAAARKQGVPTPLVREVDTDAGELRLSRVGDCDLAAVVADGAADPAVDLDPETTVARVGGHLARLHAAGIVHGDPTTRNVRVAVDDADGDAEQPQTDRPRTFLIDFGLGFHTDHVEDLAVDLHVFEQSLAGTADDPETLIAAVEERYTTVADRVETSVADGRAVVDRLREVEGRGRYQ